jgi:GNAT superfamily N-acetyltransferase
MDKEIRNTGVCERQSDVQIRLALADEAVSIASVLYQSFVEYEPFYTPEAFAATTPTADQLRERWREGPVWVAVQNDTIIGTVAVVPKGEALYIRSMAILPTARGQGIGRLLLHEVERFANERRCRRLFLSTTPFLRRAIRLYEQFGFQRSSDGPHELFGTPLFTMVKSLKPGGQPPG